MLIILAIGIDRLSREAVHWLLAHLRERLGLLLFLGVLVGIGWLLAGWRLRGRQLACWCLVPLLAVVALVCLIGPDRLFPKHPFEGPSLLILSENHALTFLDLPGFIAAVAACLLAIRSIGARLRGDPVNRGAVPGR